MLQLTTTLHLPKVSSISSFEKYVDVGTLCGVGLGWVRMGDLGFLRESEIEMIMITKKMIMATMMMVFYLS